MGSGGGRIFSPDVLNRSVSKISLFVLVVAAVFALAVALLSSREGTTVATVHKALHHWTKGPSVLPDDATFLSAHLAICRVRGDLQRD